MEKESNCTYKIAPVFSVKPFIEAYEEHQEPSIEIVKNSFEEVKFSIKCKF